MAYKVLNAGFPTDTVRRGQIKLAGNELVMKDKILEADGTAIYLKAYREAEKEAAYHLVRLLRSPGNTYNIERELEAVLAKSKMTLAQKQEEAVRWYFGPRYPSSLAALEKERLPSSKLFFRYLNVWKKISLYYFVHPQAEPGKDFQRALGIRLLQSTKHYM